MFGFGKKDPAANFWKWIEQTGPAIRAGVESFASEKPDHSIAIHELGQRLQRVHPEFFHEIGIDTGGLTELIISADGKVNLFPQVFAFVRAAPRIPGFKVTALRPRRPDQVLSLFGRTYDASDLSYRMIDEGEKVGLQVFVDDALEYQRLITVGFLMLDSILGEYDAETGLGELEFANGRPSDATPFNRLAEEFDARRPKTAH